MSHDRLVTALGRSNRSHLIKIEKGDHRPRTDLRVAIADATNVPYELFDDDDDAEAAQMAPAAAGSLLNLEAIDALLMERIGVAVEKALADAKARQ